MATPESIILSIRDQIPDAVPGDDASIDGNAYSVATLLRWINDAGRVMCHRAPIIQDWYALSSIEGQNVYELPTKITSVEQVWYDNIEMARAREGDFLTVNQPEAGNSWWFSPHVVHAIPRLFIASPAGRSAATTALNGSTTSTASTITVDATTNFMDYGFAFVEDELVRYNSVTATTLVNCLRGQGGTTPVGHIDNAVVTEANLMMKVYRLPTPLVNVTDRLEIPEGLWPLIELYVLAKVKSSEQSEQEGAQMRQEFFQLVEQMADKAPVKGLRQGTQIRAYGW